MRGTSDDCPGATRHLITEKCSECPSGTCRLVKPGIYGMFYCICPDVFIASPSSQKCCNRSFGAPWPLSVGKEDRNWRSCKADFSPPPASSKSCCSLTEEDLTQLLGTSGSCPGLDKIILASKCDECPPGTCRVGYECYCPDSFLEVHAQSECRASFDTDWPESVGKEDVDWRSCAEDAVAPPTSTESCCALSKEELDDLRGTSGECPGPFASLVLLEKCQACVAGTCRVGNVCSCPDYFLKTDSLQKKCIEAFGSSWPESVGKEDRELGSCSGTIAPPTTTAATGGGDTSGPAVEPEAAVGGEPAASEDSGSSSVGEGESSSSVEGVGSNEANNGESPGGDNDSNFNTIEVVGSVAGVISAVAAMGAGAWGLYRHKNKGRAKDPTVEMFNP